MRVFVLYNIRKRFNVAFIITHQFKSSLLSNCQTHRQKLLTNFSIYVFYIRLCLKYRGEIALFKFENFCVLMSFY